MSAVDQKKSRTVNGRQTRSFEKETPAPLPVFILATSADATVATVFKLQKPHTDENGSTPSVYRRVFPNVGSAVVIFISHTCHSPDSNGLPVPSVVKNLRFLNSTLRHRLPSAEACSQKNRRSRLPERNTVGCPSNSGLPARSRFRSKNLDRQSLSAGSIADCLLHSRPPSSNWSGITTETSGSASRVFWLSLIHI